MNTLIDRNTFLHLRLPFSLFLAPVYLFALSQAREIHTASAIIMFVALHFFIYPGSNLYNSYMDKDTGSIGGLKNPPPVTKRLYYASIVFDLAGLLSALLISKQMVVLMLVFIAVSKAYSWHRIRLKKYAISGWFTVMIFQGGYTYLLSSLAIENARLNIWITPQHLWAMLLAALLIGASYPFTQIYQHDEDSQRGDITLSWVLGVRGTFLFGGLLFVCAAVLAFNYFSKFGQPYEWKIFIASLTPVIIYFFYWIKICWNDKRNADYTRTMRMTGIASACMILCWMILFFLNNSIRI